MDQSCLKLHCTSVVSVAEDADPGTKLKCSSGHDLVVAICPFGHCHARRVAIPANTVVQQRFNHQECTFDFEVTSMDPPTLRLLS